MKTKESRPVPVIGRIFYDHNIGLWTMLLYDENDLNIEEHVYYEHYKRDILSLRKDFPTVARWEIGKRRM